REREHAAEPVDRTIAPLLVRVNDHFSVGMRPEPVAVPLEIETDLPEVVDLAVEHGPDRPVFVRERLIAGCEIDDAQAAVAKADAGADVEAVGVGTTVCDRGRHRLPPVPIHPPGRAEI